jgi:hypothetical protein
LWTASAHDAGMKYIALIASLVLAGCGAPSDEKVAGVSQSEADALNDAAEMLDANTVVPVPIINTAETTNDAE